MSEYALAATAAAPDFAPVFMRFSSEVKAQKMASTLQSTDAEFQQSSEFPNVIVAAISEDEANAYQTQGIEIIRPRQYELCDGFAFDPRSREDFAVLAPDADRSHVGRSLTDVLEQIEAPRAWETSRGRGVTIAVIDTGACGTMAEFETARRSPHIVSSAFKSDAHWRDDRGHGSMCLAIAAGSKANGGRYDGVAPEATLLPIRSTLFETDLFEIYDQLIRMKKSGAIAGPLVISNSYGSYSCVAPSEVFPSELFPSIVRRAVDAGITVVFAAGNAHDPKKCGVDPGSDMPNTIWGVNSLDEVITVGTVNRALSNRNPATPHIQSSRGPGQWTRHPDLVKPDCVAPTYGEVVWKCGYKLLDWWGTSGACPQVAGLAALLLAVKPQLTPAEVKQIITASCSPLAGPPRCIGRGLVNCASAVQALS